MLGDLKKKTLSYLDLVKTFISNSQYLVMTVLANRF